MLRQKISLFCCISACVEVFCLACHHLRRNCWHVPSCMLIASLPACSSSCFPHAPRLAHSFVRRVELLAATQAARLPPFFRSHSKDTTSACSQLCVLMLCVLFDAIFFCPRLQPPHAWAKSVPHARPAPCPCAQNTYF